MLVHEDITEQRKAEEEMRFHADVLGNVRDSVIVTDLQGRIMYWGAGATATFGYEAHEMLGQTPTILYPDQDPEQLESDLAIIRQGQEHVGEWRGRRKDGTEIWVDAKTTLMRDAEGNAVGFIGVSKDITERKQAETERNALLTQVQRALEIRGQFLSIASHELKTPVTLLRGFAQLLEEQARREAPRLGRLQASTARQIAWCD